MGRGKGYGSLLIPGAIIAVILAAVMGVVMSGAVIRDLPERISIQQGGTGVVEFNVTAVAAYGVTPGPVQVVGFHLRQLEGADRIIPTWLSIQSISQWVPFTVMPDVPFRASVTLAADRTAPVGSHTIYLYVESTDIAVQGAPVMIAAADFIVDISGGGEGGVALEYYTLTIVPDPAIGGNVSPVGVNSYPDGSQVHVSATPNYGYEFTGWSGNTPPGATNLESSRIVTITQDWYNAAHFGVLPVIPDDGDDDGVPPVDPATVVSVSGRVVDPEGIGVPSITVYLYAGGVERSSLTNSVGFFRISAEPSTTYTLIVGNYEAELRTGTTDQELDTILIENQLQWVPGIENWMIIAAVLLLITLGVGGTIFARVFLGAMMQPRRGGGL